MGYISIRRGVSSLLIVAPSLTQALRVSPNSPCTSVCTDSNISQSDPNFFDEQWKDIVCTDTALDSTPQGKKLESCFTCLQNSTYTHGSESDQDWFLYNLRYSASYCMFGYPNSTGFDSGPCTTTVGCGSLSDALELSIKNPTSLTPYDYCDVNGGAITSNQVQGCLQCIQADGEHDYMSNFLLALQGACQVKPASDSVLVLNKPLFGNDTVQVVTSSPSSDNQGPAISTSTIVGIVVGGVVLLALIAAFTFVCIRKRKNRAKEQDRASGYSFRCQTRVTPVTPRFPEGTQIDDNFQGNEKAHVMVTNGIPIGANAYPQAQYPWNSQSSLNVAISRQDSAIMRPSVITSLPPPPSAHISPRLGSPDDYSTPASAVSTRSSAPLLANPQRGYSPSPHLAQSSWSLSPRPNRLDKRWEDENQGFGNALGLVSKKKNQTNAASPVQSEVIQTSFPPPPTK